MPAMMMMVMAMMMMRAMVMMTTPVEKHDTANEVETEEHWQTEGDIHRHPLGADLAAVVGKLRGPQEVETPGDRVDGAHQQLHACKKRSFITDFPI